MDAQQMWWQTKSRKSYIHHLSNWIIASASWQFIMLSSTGYSFLTKNYLVTCQITLYTTLPWMRYLDRAKLKRLLQPSNPQPSDHKTPPNCTDIRLPLDITTVQQKSSSLSILRISPVTISGQNSVNSVILNWHITVSQHRSHLLPRCYSWHNKCALQHCHAESCCFILDRMAQIGVCVQTPGNDMIMMTSF